MRRSWSKITLEHTEELTPFRITCHSDGHLWFANIPMEGLPLQEVLTIRNVMITKAELRELDLLVPRLIEARSADHFDVMDGQFTDIYVHMNDGSIAGMHFYHEPVEDELNSLQSRLRKILREDYLKKQKARLKGAAVCIPQYFPPFPERVQE